MTDRAEPTPVVNVLALARPIRSAHQHVEVGACNDHRAVLAVNTEPFPWHHHPNSDELFLVLEGTLRLELEGGHRVDLRPSDTWVVPAGLVHRTTPLGRCVNLVFERADAETRFVE